MKRFPTYFKVWRLQAINKLQETYINRVTNSLFFMGKVIRLAFMLLVLFTIRSKISAFAGYTTDQVMVFFLAYQFVDVVAQVIYRGVYMFQHKIRSGEFDFLLLQPVNPLFQSLTYHPDINDALFLIPSTAISVYIISQLDVVITLSSLVLFLVLLLNSFLIVTALHIIILVFGILTTEVDGLMWLYRDLVQFGRFPITIYGEPIRTALFFIVPVGMMITIPAEVLLNVKPTHSIFLAIGIGIGLFLLSIKLWHWSLQKYSGAGS